MAKILSKLRDQVVLDTESAELPEVITVLSKEAGINDFHIVPSVGHHYTMFTVTVTDQVAHPDPVKVLREKGLLVE